MLRWAATPDQSPFTHRQIAEWCDRFWFAYVEMDAPPEIDALLPVLADVDCQWDLYLVNTYSLEQLQELDLDQVRLPVEWFNEWAQRLGA